MPHLSRLDDKRMARLRDVWAYVSANPGARREDIAAAVGLAAKSSVRPYLEILRDAGYITWERRRGGFTVLVPLLDNVPFVPAEPPALPHADV